MTQRVSSASGGRRNDPLDDRKLQSPLGARSDPLWSQTVKVVSDGDPKGSSAEASQPVRRDPFGQMRTTAWRPPSPTVSQEQPQSSARAAKEGERGWTWLKVLLGSAGVGVLVGIAGGWLYLRHRRS